MADNYKIAVASTDGKFVNQHFGRAESFYIFDIAEDKVCKLSEIREVKKLCSEGDHSEQQLAENAERLKDCKYVLISRIGLRASNELEKYGITPMELPDTIENALERVISFEQIQNLFERN